MGVEYIQKLVLVKLEDKSVEWRMVQVGAMPLAAPAFFRITQTDDGRFEFAWRWLPGESEESVLVKRSGSTGATLIALAMRLAASKPWTAGVPPTEPV